MGKERPCTADSFVMVKPWEWPRCHPVSGATAQRCSLSPAKTPELGDSRRGRAHPRRQAGHSRGSRPSALPGSLPKFVNTEGGGRAPGSERERRGKGGVITHRRRRRGRWRTAARCRAWPACGGPACWGTCRGNSARDWGFSRADRGTLTPTPELE